MGGEVVQMINQRYTRPSGYVRQVIWLKPLQVMEISGPKGKLCMIYVTKPLGDKIQITAKFMTRAGCVLFSKDWPPNSFIDLTSELGVMLMIRGVTFNQRSNDIQSMLIEATTTH